MRNSVTLNRAELALEGRNNKVKDLRHFSWFHKSSWCEPVHKVAKYIAYLRQNCKGKKHEARMLQSHDHSCRYFGLITVTFLHILRVTVESQGWNIRCNYCSVMAKLPQISKLSHINWSMAPACVCALAHSGRCLSLHYCTCWPDKVSKLLRGLKDATLAHIWSS